jgi:hypothetical protein
MFPLLVLPDLCADLVLPVPLLQGVCSLYLSSLISVLTLSSPSGCMFPLLDLPDLYADLVLPVPLLQGVCSVYLSSLISVLTLSCLFPSFSLYVPSTCPP